MNARFRPLALFALRYGALPVGVYLALLWVLSRTETATVLLGAVAGAQWLGLLGMLALLALRVYTVLVLPPLLAYRVVRSLLG